MACLLLIPTASEREIVQPLLSPRLRADVRIELCGFGPIAAAARASQLLAAIRPERVLLLGIGGAFEDELDLGAARAFRRVACYGVGAGQGADHSTASQLGWTQWPGSGIEGHDDTVGDVIPIKPFLEEHAPRCDLLLTACAASANPEEAAERSASLPDAVVEDMEGFGVGLACHLADVPFEIVRGVSNRVGIRDHSQWKIRESLYAAAEFVNSYWI